MPQLGFLLLALQLRERTRLFLLVEVGGRRILMIFVFRKYRLLYERGVTLLRRYLDAQLHVVIAMHRCLLALLRALLEVEQRRVLRQRSLYLVLGPGERHAVQRDAFIALLAHLMEIRLRRPKALLIMQGLLIKVKILAVGDLVVRIPVLRIGLDQLGVIVYLSHVPVHVIDKHTCHVGFYQERSESPGRSVCC